MAILKIDTVDRDAYLIDYEFIKTIEWYNSFGEVELMDDENDVLRGVLAKFQDIQIFNDEETEIQFRGVIVDFDPEPNDNANFLLAIQDYWFLFTRKHISTSFTNMTASAIILSIMSTYFPNDFTVTGVVSTTKLYTYKLRGQNLAKFLQELAGQEGFIIFVDTSKDIVFRAETSESTNKTWTYADEMLDEDFKDVGRDIVNAVLVEGNSGSPQGVGVGAFYVDSALVEAMGGTILEMAKVVDSTLTTNKQCRDRGETEVRRRNQSAPIGTIMAIKDFDVDIGKIHTMTIPHRGYTDALFLVRSAKHTFASDKTIIKVIYTSKDNTELVSEVLLQARQLQEIDTDDSTIFPKYVQAVDDLILKAYVTVERRASAGSYYGNAFYGGSYYGVQNTIAFEEALAEEQIIVVNEGFESLFKIIAQIATIPNDLRNANSYLAVGSSNSPISFADTTINSESARVNTEAGDPDLSTPYQLSWEFIISDGDLTTGTIRNIGLLNTNALGELFFAGVLSEAIAKSANEDVKFTIRLTFETLNSYITDIGRTLFRDLLVNNSSDYLDNTGSWIEIVTAPVFRDGMEPTSPEVVQGGTKIIYQSQLTAAEIVSNSLNGKSYTGIDIYDAVSGGNKIFDGESGYTIGIITDENQFIEAIINGARE